MHASCCEVYIAQAAGLTQAASRWMRKLNTTCANKAHCYHEPREHSAPWIHGCFCARGTRQDHWTREQQDDGTVADDRLLAERLATLLTASLSACAFRVAVAAARPTAAALATLIAPGKPLSTRLSADAKSAASGATCCTDARAGRTPSRQRPWPFAHPADRTWPLQLRAKLQLAAARGTTALDKFERAVPSASPLDRARPARSRKDRAAGTALLFGPARRAPDGLELARRPRNPAGEECSDGGGAAVRRGGSGRARDGSGRARDGVRRELRTAAAEVARREGLSGAAGGRFAPRPCCWERARARDVLMLQDLA
ncbi:hypothetical protein B0H15DRAFT_1021579 [Mycena belliarum]|uniref:Uncharacterized protein n=1 Tax=Mycena belliarum TaxID=1033014 RepID=A0AAD6UAF2_9AGAR|nr:hypothetical protein B0H15DRAFT_1021579 [Mycena belliae]